jgi:glucose-6-phosphate 1-dehydrogenase
MVIFGASGDLARRSLLPSLYEETGVVRDMLQNHLLSLLCMVALEPPVDYDARSLRDETVKVLRAIVDPVVSRLEHANPDELHGYAAGSWGPAAAATLLERDGRRWLHPSGGGPTPMAGCLSLNM